MNLDVVIQHPDQYIVVWHEPACGVDEAGPDITVDVRNSVSIAGAIAMQRYYLSKINREYLTTATSLDLLRDFMAENWALIAQKETD